MSSRGPDCLGYIILRELPVSEELTLLFSPAPADEADDVRATVVLPPDEDQPAFDDMDEFGDWTSALVSHVKHEDLLTYGPTHPEEVER